MRNVSAETVDAICDQLDEVARGILRLFVMNEARLSSGLKIRMVKFLYGLMNQRLTIRPRLQKYGDREIDKVMKFIGKALEVHPNADEELCR